jgi:hypothetical protein
MSWFARGVPGALCYGREDNCRAERINAAKTSSCRYAPVRAQALALVRQLRLAVEPLRWRLPSSERTSTGRRRDGGNHRHALRQALSRVHSITLRIADSTQFSASKRSARDRAVRNEAIVPPLLTLCLADFAHMGPRSCGRRPQIRP